MTDGIIRMNHQTPALASGVDDLVYWCADLQLLAASACEALIDDRAAEALASCNRALNRWMEDLCVLAGLERGPAPSWRGRLRRTWIVIMSSVNDEAAIISMCREQLLSLAHRFQDAAAGERLAPERRAQLHRQAAELHDLIRRLECAARP